MWIRDSISMVVFFRAPEAKFPHVMLADVAVAAGAKVQRLTGTAGAIRRNAGCLRFEPLNQVMAARDRVADLPDQENTIMAFIQSPAARHDVRPITVALEGGGSLGAFAWGVLDRLVDVPGIQIKAVSGASAGAINAALLVQGLATGGPVEAKRLLETFWRRVAIAAGSLPGPVGEWLHMVSGTMAPVVDAISASLRINRLRASSSRLIHQN